MSKSRRGGEKWYKFTQTFWAHYRLADVTPICALCGHPINPHARGRDPWSRSVDHIIPVERGGQEFALSNAQGTHRICNTTRQMRPMTEFATQAQRAAFRKVVEGLVAVQRAKTAHQEINNNEPPQYVFHPWGWGPNEETSADGTRFYSCCGLPDAQQAPQTVHQCGTTL